MRALISTIALLLMTVSVNAAKQPDVTTSVPNQPSTEAVQAVSGVTEAPSFKLPEGATVDTELNLSESDLLGMVRKALPAFSKGFGEGGGELGTLIQRFDLDSLATSVQTVKALRFVQFKLKEKAVPDKLLPFFESQVPSSKGWSRMLYSTTMVRDSTIAVYTLGGERYLGVLLNSKGNKNYVVGTVGFLDLPKIVSWAGTALKGIISMDDDSGKTSVPSIPAIPAVPSVPPVPAVPSVAPAPTK